MLYSILLIGLLLCSFLDWVKIIPEHDKLILFKFWIVVFLLLKGLAWDTGPDFAQFYATFEYADWSNIFSYQRYGSHKELMEPGFVFLNVLGNTFLPHYTFFKLITCGFILYAFSKLILKYIPQYKISALALMMVTTEMFPVRQTIVTGLFCLALIYIIERNLRNYIILIFISFTIHKSSLLLLPFYYLYNIKYNVKWYILIYFLFIGFRLIIQQNLMNIFSSDIVYILTGGSSDTYYVTNKDIQDISFVTVLSSIIHLIVFGYLNNQNSKLNILNSKVINLFSNIYFVLLLCFVLGTLPGLIIVYRFANHFLVVYPILILSACQIIVRKFKLARSLFAFSLFFVAWLIKFSNNMIFDKEGTDYKSTFEPYYSVFDSDGHNLIRNKKWPNYND